MAYFEPDMKRTFAVGAAVRPHDRNDMVGEVIAISDKPRIDSATGETRLDWARLVRVAWDTGRVHWEPPELLRSNAGWNHGPSNLITKNADKYAELFMDYIARVPEWVYPSDELLAELGCPSTLFDSVRFVIHRDWT